jgi:hypothetical protein
MKRLKSYKGYTVTKVAFTFILSRREKRFAIRVPNASTLYVVTFLILVTLTQS